jgi:hypothetical protein
MTFNIQLYHNIHWWKWKVEQMVPPSQSMLFGTRMPLTHTKECILEIAPDDAPIRKVLRAEMAGVVRNGGKEGATCCGLPIVRNAQHLPPTLFLQQELSCTSLYYRNK